MAAFDGAALLPDHGREVDDPPGAALAHPRAGDAAAEVGAAQVGGEHVVPFGDVDLPERAELGARGVVDEHVDVAHPLDQSLPGGELAHVVLDGGRALPQLGCE
jgi:hypothetical protein